MIPNTDKALRMISQRMMTTLLPDLQSNYTMSDGLMLGLLINAIADELEAGIERRLQDIADMQALLNTDEKPASHTLADVNALHDRLTRQLIELHAAAEDNVDDALIQAIWQYLRAQSDRHRITAVP